MVAIVLSLITPSCQDDKGISFPIEPQIKFEAIQFVKGREEFNTPKIDTIIFTFSFTDGDGDLGRRYDQYVFDIEPPYNFFFFVFRDNGLKISCHKLYNHEISRDELISFRDHLNPPFDTLPNYSQCSWIEYHEEPYVLDTLYIVKNQRFYNLDITFLEKRDNGFLPVEECSDFDGLLPPLHESSGFSGNSPFRVKLKSPNEGSITFKMTGFFLSRYYQKEFKIKAQVIDESSHLSNTIESTSFIIK
jgi:hypothetical protein